jgi:hypothetical protein
MATIDQHSELYRAGSAELAQGVEGRADRSAGEKHVVDKNDDRVIDSA